MDDGVVPEVGVGVSPEVGDREGLLGVVEHDLEVTEVGLEASDADVGVVVAVGEIDDGRAVVAVDGDVADIVDDVDAEQSPGFEVGEGFGRTGTEEEAVQEGRTGGGAGVG